MEEIEVKNIAEAQEILENLSETTPLNKPTEAEVNEATQEFNKKAAEFNSKKFAIGDSKEALEIYDFVLEFLEKHVYWTKNGWMGVLKMHEELTESKTKRKKNDSFTVGYQALEFLFYALSNPGGSGIESAKAIEKLADIYIHTLELAGIQLEAARKELKDIQWLQDKVTAMAQGFYLEREDGIALDEAKFAPPTADDLLKKKI
jgi:hypothetical protein